MSVVLRLELADQTYDVLRRITERRSYGDTIELVAIFLMLRGCRGLLEDGVSEAAHLKRGKLSIVGDDDGRVWCDQCDRRVSVAHAGNCASPFCKARAA